MYAIRSYYADKNGVATRPKPDDFAPETGNRRAGTEQDIGQGIDFAPGKVGGQRAGVEEAFNPFPKRGKIVGYVKVAAGANGSRVFKKAKGILAAEDKKGRAAGVGVQVGQ